MHRGIDVSYWQGSAIGSRIAWEEVSKSGIEFAIIRIGDGTFRDPDLQYNVSESIRVGLKTELYYYTRYVLSPEQTVMEIMRGWNAAVLEGMPKHSRVWIDKEDTSQYALRLSVEERIKWTVGVVDTLPIRHGIYSGCWWWKPYMGSTDVFSTIDGWLANYPFGDVLPPQNFPTESSRPNECGGWVWDKNLIVWQYSSSGRIPGITTKVDLNVAVSKYMEDNMEEIQVGEWVRVGVNIPPGSQEAYAVIPRSMYHHIYAHAYIQDLEGIGFGVFHSFDVSVDGFRLVRVRLTSPPSEHPLNVVVAFQRVA